VSYALLKAQDTGAALIVEERGDERNQAGTTAGVSFDLARAYLFDAKTGM
jgi:hypothetical protein